MEGMEYRSEYDWALCKVCHTRFIDRSSGKPGEYMCKECRQELTKLRVPKWLIAALSIAVVLALVMCFYTGNMYRKNALGESGKLEGEKALKEAEELFVNGKQYTALIGIDEYLAQKPSNVEVALKAVEMSMESGQYDMAAYMINTYLLDKGLTDKEYYDLSLDIEKINAYYDTADAIYGIYSDMLSNLPENLSDEESERVAKEWADKILALADNEQYDEEYLYFFVGNYLSLEVAESPEYRRLVLNYPPTAAYAAGRLAVTERNKGNFDDALNWIEIGEETNGENPELVRAKATIELAKGNYAEGLSIIEWMYELAPDELYIRDTYGVALYANGKTDRLNEMMKEAESAGYEFEEDFYQVLSGEISVRDYYVKEEE